MIGFFGAFISIIFSKTLSFLTFGDTKNYFWFILLSINFIFLSLNINRTAVLQSKRMIQEMVFSNVLTSFLTTIISLPIYFFFKTDGIIPVILISTIITLLVNIYFTKNVKKIQLKNSFSEIFKDGVIRIKSGFLLSINVIFGLICTYIIKLYLNENGTNTQVLGFYEVSTVILLSYFGIVFNAMSTDFYPRLVINKDDDFKSNVLINDQIEIGLLIVTPLICFVYFIAPLLIEILYSKEFGSVIYILKAGLFAIVIKTIVWPFAFLILIKSSTKIYFWQEIISDLFLLLATFGGYFFFGLQGIGLASLLQFSIYGIVIYFIINKKYNFRFRKDTKFIITISILFAFLNYLFTSYIDYPSCYLPTGIILVLSILFSYKELDRRITIYSYYLKLKNKFKQFKN